MQTTPATQRNLETIKGLYAAFGKGDVPSILALLDEQVTWEPGYDHNNDIPWLKSGTGHQHVLGFFGALQAFDFKRFDIYAVMGDGPWVVALTELELFHKATGKTLVERCEPHVWKFNDAGKVISMRHAADTRAHARIAGAPVDMNDPI